MNHFKWNREKATLLLSLEELPMHTNVFEYAKQLGLVPKPELHITLLSFQNGKKILQALNAGHRFDPEDILQIAQSFEWKIQYATEYFLLERTISEFVLHGKVQTPEHTRRSIIQKVIIPDMVLFLEKVSEFTGAIFEIPIPHVTLFSWSNYEPEMNSGIVLNSQTDFERYFKEKIEI